MTVAGARRPLTVLPLADPAKPSWTYADLAVRFELSVDRFRRRMPELEAAGFPAPLPYSVKPKRWRPGPVIAWQARHEARIGAAPLTPRLVETHLPAATNGR